MAHRQQGRFKSLAIQNDRNGLSVMRNALRSTQTRSGESC